MSKRNSYEVGFKLELVAYAEKHGNRASERKFGVSEKLVREWRAKKDELKEMPKTQKAARFSISPYQNLEKELYDWLVDLTNKGLVVKRLSIRNKASQLAPKYNLSQFKASIGWCTRFLNRCKRKQLRVTQSAKKVPKIVLKKVPNSDKYVKKVPNAVHKKVSNSAESVGKVPNAAHKKAPSSAKSVEKVTKVVNKKVPNSAKSINKVSKVVHKKVPSSVKPVKKVSKVVHKKVPNSAKSVNKVPKDVNKKTHRSATLIRKKCETLDCSLGMDKTSMDFDELGNNIIIDSVKIEPEIEIDKDEVDAFSCPHVMDLKETSKLKENTLNFTEELRNVIIKEEIDEEMDEVLTRNQQHVNIQVQKTKTGLVSDQSMQATESISIPQYTGTKLLQRQTIRKHVAAVPTSKNRFACPTCKKIFYQRTSFMTHLAEHKVEKPFECELCHQRFHKSLSLRAHQASHNRTQGSNTSLKA